MVGSKSGVGSLLLQDYPRLMLWHCANHRLELSVNDTVKESSGANPFKIFMDRLYSPYSKSQKNEQELKQCTSELAELLKVGRVLDTRRAVSLRSVKAIWKSYGKLASHFSSERASKD